MLEDADKVWLRRKLGNGVRFDESMARHTYFRIGGPVDAWIEPKNEQQLGAVLEWSQRRIIPYQVIGGGTNLLVRDGGIRGLVIHLKRMADDVQWDQQGPRIIVSSSAGVPTKRICALALKNGWQGMNFALGIPGTLGGAIMMNAGTAHGCMADVVDTVAVMTASGEKVELNRRSMDHGYRKLGLPDELTGQISPAVLIAARLTIGGGERKRTRHQARQWLEERSRQQPTWQPSAGCFFKNPSENQPAGRIIDEAGLKGFRVGDAQVSFRHANFIINRGNASAADVLAVAARIRETVKKRFNIDLVPEVRIVGEEKTGAQKSI